MSEFHLSERVDFAYFLSQLEEVFTASIRAIATEYIDVTIKQIYLLKVNPKYLQSISFRIFLVGRLLQSLREEKLN